MKITKKKNQNKMMEVPLHPRLRKFNFKGHLSHCTVKKKA
jgi:hypothetical protein